MQPENAAIALFGVESIFTAEFVETLVRLGFRIGPAILTGVPEWDMSGLDPVAANGLHSAQLQLPVVIPWVTPGLKWQKHRVARGLGFSRFPAIIDSYSSLARSATVGDGVFLNGGATVGAFAALENFALLNRNASIGHHSRLGAYSSIGPGATVAARCDIGRGTMIGSGAVIAPGVTIGANCLIAAGAVVTKPAPDNVMMAGNPGRVIKTGYGGYKDVEVPE